MAKSKSLDSDQVKAYLEAIGGIYNASMQLNKNLENISGNYLARRNLKFYRNLVCIPLVVGLRQFEIHLCECVSICGGG